MGSLYFFMIQLVLTDLDGTLLRDDRTISNYTKDVLKKLKSLGIKFGFSTGRAKSSIQHYIKQICPDVIIANGGAEIFEGKNLIYSCGFSVKEAQCLIDAAYKICGNQVEITCDSENKTFWNKTKSKNQIICSPDLIYSDFKPFNQKAMKICVKTWDEEKAKQIALSLGHEKCNFIKFSDVPWHSFYKKEATKENGIKTLGKYFSIDLENIISFGDDFNDIGMLKICGKGIAMENAITQVKEAAKEITLSNNNNGVAFWLEKNIINKRLKN